MEQPPPPPPPPPPPWVYALDLHHTPLSSSSSSFSLLRRCSLHHRSSLPPSSSPSPPHQPPHRLRIPGPAASIQAAMHRKDRHAPPRDFIPDNHINFTAENVELAEISTQEYIRRVEEDSGEEFSRDPWLFAIDSLRRDGAFNATSLKDIKNCLNADRIDQVVAVVKSCTSNGFGDMIVILKDPTDTVAASVHRKVLSAGEFGNLITAGSVLILQKVVVFSSSYASCYLNITRRNVVKVISVDCEVQYFPDTNLDSAQELPENATALLSSTRRLSEDVQLSCNVNDNTSIQKAKEWETDTQASSLSSSKHIESSAYKISQEPILKDHVDSGYKALCSLSKRGDNSGRVAQPGPAIVVASASCEDQARNGNPHVWQQNGPELERLLRGNNCTASMTVKRRNPLQNGPELDRCTPNDAQKHGTKMDISSGPSLVDNLVDREIAKPNDPESTGSGGPKKQRLGLISRTSVQGWTDEQLCVLEMDDD